MERDRTEGGGLGDQGELRDVADALRELGDEAREALGRLAQELELERRIEENPLAVLGVAAAAGFVLGGGLWPVLRPFVKAALRTAVSPANLLTIGAAVGAMRAARMREDVPRPAAPETH
jgi:hypothetical protein